MKQSLTKLILLGILIMVANSAMAEELTNKYCPVTTSELAEEQFSVDYQGQTIYFCCTKCKKDFLNDPETYLANLESQVGDSEPAEPLPDANADLSRDDQTDYNKSSSIVGLTGKFHPMLTHFPIALVLSALVFMILAPIVQKQTMNDVSVYCIYLAALTGIGTVLLGLAAGSVVSYPSFLDGYFEWHRWLGIVTGLATIVTAFAGRRLLRQSSKGTLWSYRIALLINALLVGVTGHLGAALVFGPDHFKF